MDRAGVALRKESVDRNAPIHDGLIGWVMSLSARRAWIEINRNRRCHSRNNRSLSARRAWIEITQCRLKLSKCTSLSARRAWIEIARVCCSALNLSVALRKESVDRNRPALFGHGVFVRRSPQGERG